MNKQDAYVQKMKAQLDLWKAEIDRLNARADELSADARIEFAKQIERLYAAQREASGKLDKLGKAAEGSWEELREGLDRVRDELGQAIRKATSRFR